MSSRAQTSVPTAITLPLVVRTSKAPTMNFGAWLKPKHSAPLKDTGTARWLAPAAVALALSMGYAATTTACLPKTITLVASTMLPETAPPYMLQQQATSYWPDACVEDGFILNSNTVGLDHGQGIVSVMIHLSRIDVTEGNFAQADQVIRRMGSPGFATGLNLAICQWRGRWTSPLAIWRHWVVLRSEGVSASHALIISRSNFSPITSLIHGVSCIHF